MKNLFTYLLTVSLSFAGLQTCSAEQVWTTPTLINTSMLMGDDHTDGSMARDEFGRVIVIWVQKQLNRADTLMVAKSTNGGLEFSGEKVLAYNSGFGFPRIAYTGNGNWLVTYNPAGYSTDRVSYITSADSGETWSYSRVIEEAPSPPMFYVNDAYSVASDGKGVVIIPLRNMFIRSVDYGQSWTYVMPSELYHRPASIYENIRVATNGSGKWVCVYEVRTFDYPARWEVKTLASYDSGRSWYASAGPGLSGSGNTPHFEDFASNNDHAVLSYRSSVGFNGWANLIAWDFRYSTWSSNTVLSEETYNTTLPGVLTSNGSDWIWMGILGTFESENLETWVKTAGPRAYETPSDVLPLDGGGYTCLISRKPPSGKAKLSIMVSGLTPPTSSTYNVKLNQLSKPTFFRSTWNEIQLKWKLSASNLGPGASEDTIAGVWLTHKNAPLDRTMLINTIELKSLGVAKPGKKPKSKKITVKASGSVIAYSENFDAVYVAVMQGYGEEGFQDNGILYEIPELDFD